MFPESINQNTSKLYYTDERHYIFTSLRLFPGNQLGYQTPVDQERHRETARVSREDMANILSNVLKEEQVSMFCLYLYLIWDVSSLIRDIFVN